MALSWWLPGYGDWSVVARHAVPAVVLAVLAFGVGLAGSGAMASLADDLVSDELWVLVEPLLPAPPRPPYGGRHRTISDPACLAAIVYADRPA